MSVQLPDPGNAQSGSRVHPRSTHTRTTSAVIVPPGWYSDPHQAGDRWLDGAQWTADVVEVAPPAARRTK